METHRRKKKVGPYSFEAALGAGEFGEVFLATSELSGESFAIKVLPKSLLKDNPMISRLVETEIQIMGKINHPNIVRLYDLLESSSSYYLVMEHCNKGDFEQYLAATGRRFLGEKEARESFSQVASAFKELRRQKIIHRDFKLSNLLLHDETVKLSDFGLAKRGLDLTKTVVGSYLTMAPELLSSEGDVSYSSKADLWSIGFVFYQLLVGDPPFFGLSPSEIAADIRGREGRLRFPSRVPAAAKDLVRKLLVSDPRERIDWPDFFSHPFLSPPCVSTASLPSLPRNEESPAPRAHSASELTTPQEDRVIGVSRRFFHEKNKILFIVYTVRNVRKLERLTIEEELKRPFALISAHLLRKAILLTELNIFSIKNRENVFEMSGYSEFLTSEHSSAVLANFQDDHLNFSNYFRHLSKPSAQGPPPSTEGLSLQELNAQVLRNLEELKRLLPSQASVPRQAFLLCLVSVFYSIHCDRFFANGDCAERFDWTSFYSRYEKMQESELTEILF